MTSKEYLYKFRSLEKLIKSRMKEIEYWRNLAEQLSAPGLEQHYNPNRPDEASYAHCFAMISEIQEKVDKETAELLLMRNEIDSRIGKLEDYEEQLVLRHRYLEHMEWEEIMRIMTISESTVFRIHRKALKHLKISES